MNRDDPETHQVDSSFPRTGGVLRACPYSSLVQGAPTSGDDPQRGWTLV